MLFSDSIMLRKEQLFDKYEEAKSIYMSMRSSNDVLDKFNSEKYRLMMNYLKETYIRMGDETDEQIINSVETDMEKMKLEWKDWIDVSTKGPVPSYWTNEFTKSNIDDVISNITNMIKFD